MATQDQELYSGLVRLHILHHAAHEPIFGQAIIEELGRHGYRLSAGTVYPILHGLERKGYLRSTEQRLGKTVRRLYTATGKGERALAAAKEKVRELFGELFEHGHGPARSGSREKAPRRRAQRVAGGARRP